MRINRTMSMLAIALSILLAGCTSQQQDPQQLKEKTAEATATLKRDAKAVAEGVREGWSQDKPLDLNHSTKDQLMALPGVSPADADRVIEGRPYSNPNELLARHIVSKTEYDRISDRITAK